MNIRIIPLSIFLLLAFIAKVNSQVTFNIPQVAAAPGSYVCVPITIQNFTDINGYQLAFEYDQSVMSYDTIIFNLPGNLAGANETADAINISWVYNFSDCISLPDNEVLFQLCFDIIGNLGDSSPLTISDGSPALANPPEVTDCNVVSIPTDVSDAGIVIIAVDLTGDIGTCNTPNNTSPAGAIQVAMTTGAAPFSGTYEEVGNPANSGMITFIGENGSSPNNLTSGDYMINITDTNGEMLNASATVNIGPALILGIDETDPSCNGVADGTLILNNGNPNLGGTGPYDIIWSTGDLNVQTVTNLGANNYSVTVHDANNCTVVETEGLIDPPLIMTTEVSRTNISCAGLGSDGALSVIGTGGTIAPGSDYTYSWTGPGGFTASTASITGLGTGEYCVVTSDDNMCPVPPVCFILDLDAAPIIIDFDTQDLTCAANMDGSATVNFTPGDGMITSIEWNTGSTGPTITGLNAGTYFVTINDDAGCSVFDSTMITSSGIVVTGITNTPPTCAQFDNGLVGVQTMGGSGSANFEWSNGVSGPNDQVIFGLECGITYTVTITDAGCPPIIESIPLACPDTIAVVVGGLVDVLCDGGIQCDGQAMATASGGTAGTGLYDFTWNSNPTLLDLTSSSITTLCQGPNFLIVNDDDCPSDTIFFEIGAPEPITVVFPPMITDISCFGKTDGAITVNAMGGDGNYNFQWTDGPNSATYSNLGAGNYTLMITDGNGCNSGPKIFPFDEPEEIAMQSITTEPTCSGFDDGTVQMSFTGGTGSGTYTWTPNVSTSSEAIGLAGGSYEVQVTDANGCMQDTIVMLMNPPAINYTLDTIAAPHCFGESALVNVSMADGGSGGPYTFSVGSSVRRPVGTPIFILPGSDIDVEIYDVNGCFASETVDIPAPEEIQIIFSQDEYEIDLGTDVLLNPIILPNNLTIDSILWSPIDTNLVKCQVSLTGTNFCKAINVSPIVDTKYSITVIDEFGCTQDASVLVKITKNREVYIPNAFRPNGDGSNDFFSIYVGPAVERINSVDVYTRWGEQVVGLKNIEPIGTKIDLWDGSAGNKRTVLNPGVFIYVIDVAFKDKNNFTFKGDITLLR